MAPLLKQTFTISKIKQLSREALNGIRGAYYSNHKNGLRSIDKSIKLEDLTPIQFATMLKEMGCSVIDDSAPPKPTKNSEDEALKKSEITLQNRENALKNREARLDEQAMDLSRRENELNQKYKILLDNEKKLNEKKNTLNEKEAKLQQKEDALNKRETEIQQKEEALSRQENKLQQKESTLDHSMSSISSTKKDEASYLGDIDDPQQVVGIKLRQSERTRLLSKDGERSRLIEEAAREICNKWLQIREGKFDTTDGHTTEEFVYDFIQEFAKSNFPYIGKNVYQLVLYDLKKRREEKNAVTSEV